MKYRIVLFGLIILACGQIFAQDVSYARKIIDTLSSASMHGRGYVNNGDQKAAEFIRNEFKNDSLKSFGNDYFQSFKISIGTLPGKVAVQIGKNKMTPAVDYLVSASSATTKGKFKIIRLDSQIVNNETAFKKFLGADFSKKIILLDENGIKDQKNIGLFNTIERNNLLHAKGVISTSDNLIWDVSDALTLSTGANITIKKSSLPKQSRKIKVDIEQKLQTDHRIINLAGYIEGSTKPDSFVVFTAHYDHLGQMGADVYFPGANDNASGTALLLNLAKYYSQNKPDYSIAFITFAGEEAGLLGSEYYVRHPLFPLSNIRFLVNLDIEGTGEDGIKVVNGTVFEKEFNLLTSVNDKKKYLKTIGKRGEAAISDHYPFYAKGVKSFYIYTLGGVSEYHNIYDKQETLPLTKYNELFRLLIDFMKTLNN
jgi:hypothetical protein